jgi:alcohol dehydrogenase (cytochrome c)
MLKRRAALLAATSTIVLVLAVPPVAAQQAVPGIDKKAEHPSEPVTPGEAEIKAKTGVKVEPAEAQAQAAEQPTGPTKPVTWEDIRNDQQTTGDVVSYGLGPRAQRYSPLDKINTETVQDLVPAWSLSFGGEKQRGQEAQPLVFDGTIFVTGSYSRLWAIDARTGKELWEYDHRLPGDILPCCDVINRGPAVYDDLVIFGTLDAQLLAFDQKTGKRRWREKIADYKDAYTFSAAPLIVNDMVVTGLSGGEFGVVGEVQARDAKTGKSIWTRPTVEGHMGTFRSKESTMTGERNKTWEGDTWRHGGGAPWNGGTYDPETNLIYMGTGNPSPWNAHGRPGDNLYTSSILALNPENGEIVWHFQYTPHDSWDFDGTNEFIPFDYEENGRTVKAGGHANRNGFFYVLDRTNGKFLRAFPFVSKITWAERIDENGKPVETGNRPGNPADVQQTGGVQKGEAVFSAPSFLGAKNWNPIAYSLDTGLFYVPSNEWGMDIWNEPITYKKGAAFLGAGFTIKPLYKDHIGVLRAVDPKTGKIVWEHENPAPLWSGVLATKGGLVFAGTPEGLLKAFDAKTGKELWSFQTGSGVVGSPITWEMDGEQYVAVVSGWGGAVPIWGGEVAKFVKDLNQGGSLWAFKLHKPSARAGQ